MIMTADTNTNGIRGTLRTRDGCEGRAPPATLPQESDLWAPQCSAKRNCRISSRGFIACSLLDRGILRSPDLLLAKVTPGGGLRALRGTLGALCILIMVMLFREHIWGTRPHPQPGIATSAEAAPRMPTECGQFEKSRSALSTTRSLRGCCVRIAGRLVWSATRLT